VDVDARLVVVVALVVLAVCLAVGFTRAAIAIRRDYEARFRRVRQRLEDDATSLVNSLFRRDS
jgi:C4-dicarboxylate-specific signal transduction histidine kinase